MKFRRWGKWEGEATSDWWRIWESAWAKWPEVTSQSCQKNVHGCDSPGVEWQQYRSIPKPTPSLIYQCEAMGGAEWFHWQKQRLERAIYSNITVQEHLGAKPIGRRVYGMIYNRANENEPHIWPDFLQLLPFKYFQGETWTHSKNICGQNEARFMEGDCEARNLTTEGNPPSPC